MNDTVMIKRNNAKTKRFMEEQLELLAHESHKNLLTEELVQISHEMVNIADFLIHNY
ncbi:MAG TPA: hypothetical protein IAB62_05725 [Candidatus Coprocola pullicola]|nr:hypothetical protein [Candidatus Coprocola pullicola]